MQATEWRNKYNAFNSLKALVHVKYWNPIVTNDVIPPPIFVSIDPCGTCNLECSFCNAKESMQVHKSFLDIATMDVIVDTLSKWGTKAVCIGGGGESLINKETSYLIEKLVAAGIEVGVVTNGILVSRHIEALSKCKWVGISVDAATSETYATVKGTSEKMFEKCLDGIKQLTQCLNVEVSYKFLIHPLNYKEIYAAASLAKEVGCDLIHLRPGGDPWFDLDGRRFNFTSDMVDEGIALIEKSRVNFEDASFKVYGIMHKFSRMWGTKKSFSSCYATAVSCVIQSDGTVGLCCDRRGDESLTLCHVSELKDTWGSEKHKKLIKDIQISKCPRCTYSHINEIFENVIIDDTMGYNFY